MQISKFEREFDVELHGTDDNRELMVRRSARREASGRQKLTVRYPEFAKWFTRYRSISLMSSLY
jgi:hypothetical protein